MKNLQLKFMFSIGGRSTGGTLRGKEESTPLVDDGFMYVTDTWSRVMKFDVRSGTSAVPLWRYDPKITRSRTTRGLAMYGNKIFLSTYDARLIALDRDNGEVAWEIQAAAPMDPKTGTPSKTQAFSGAPLAIKIRGRQGPRHPGRKHRRLAGHAKLGRRVRGRHRQARVAHLHDPGTGRAGFGDLEGQSQRLSHRRRKRVADRAPTIPRRTSSISAPATPSRPSIPNTAPATISITASTIALDADTGRMVWYFQETPNEHWDFDTPSPKMLYEVNVNGEPRKVVANFSRNGFFYTLDRASGQFLRADQYQEKVTWTKGIDPKTGKPADYDPSLDVQRYAGHRPAARQARAGSLPVVQRIADVLSADLRRQADDRLCLRRRGLLRRHHRARRRWTRTRTGWACACAARSRAAAPPTARCGRST